MLDPVPPERARFPARHSVGLDAAVAAQRGDGHRLKEAEFAAAAVAAGPAPRPAAAMPDRVPLQPDRITPFQHLGVGEPGVGHLGLHYIGACEAWPRARSAGHRLVVLVTL